MSGRALGLVRVSKEREGLVSPDIQRTAIADHATRQGYALTGCLEGIDQSGSQSRSAWWPTLERAVAAVERHEYDVLVLWKFSRAARHRLRWATMVDRVETAGGRIESATEQFDTTTSSGRFARGMLAELNAFEAERIGEVWRDVHADRLRRGLTHNGRARFGYTYADGHYTPDPSTGPVLADLYARFIAGASAYALVQDLNRRGIPTTTGGMWTDRTLRRVLDSGFAAGVIHLEHRPTRGQQRRQAAEWVPGSHTPVIDDATWAAYAAAKRSRTRVAPRSVRSPYLLSGIIRCGRCGGAMTAGTFGKARTPKYRCETRRGTGGVGCDAGFVSAAYVHAAVFEWLLHLASDLDTAAAAATAGQTARAATTGDVERWAREVTRLERALVKLRQQHAEDDDSDESEYRAARDDYRARLADARGQHADALETTQRLHVAPAAVARPLVDEWDTLGVEGRREALRRLVRHVRVTTYGRGTPADVDPVPVWEPSGSAAPA